MDHLIDCFELYIDSSFEDFYREWTSGKYMKYAECPSYYELRTLLDSVNPLRKYMGWKPLLIRDLIDCWKP